MPDTQPKADANPDQVERIRYLEDRVLKLETIAAGLGDGQSDLRAEMRTEIASLRTQITDLKDELGSEIKTVGSKVDRVMGGKAVVTALITLATSILGSGAVHIALSVGR
ncbi:hypothetical protein [Gluconobacter wancherniae]|uniref:Uncharacterized protein n=1 Tax=Gluconobacter wancherniae NBRC 103581 TaxID=656744 RepID=A0A511B0P1_9PROT|nr:hypothetical protein [Gluconobacter wancherniae]GBD55721.1 hypothetical protein NBRC103581_00288 [Gluconobacter wancherniae NBRC 103581]GBR66252.1 hypothetical protein AA103581_2255 [Gluconobacter wancherniae NBRC 103581]GEK93372.1 hypothetical protein GWA01_11420 [Gluconobacter wancherniae NBRC 103581]